MNAIDIITKKRQGKSLSSEEIHWFIDAYVKGVIPDYQTSAWLMAICFQGMTKKESFHLTDAMLKSGKQLNLSNIGGTKIDKHSTGGVGDKTSLIVGPIVASCGIKFAKLAGRGLGHTGGTIDKLESIPGLHVNLIESEWKQQVSDIGIAIGTQTSNLVPADKKLYALRDVTGTVSHKALIASSVMSKKIATGADGIVLDVKFGLGSFLSSFDEAKELAELMLDIAMHYGIPTRAVLSDMNEPLGYAVGNALEIKESIDALMGKGEKRLSALCTSIAIEMVGIAHPDKSQKELELMVSDTILSGTALEKMKGWLLAQGAEIDLTNNANALPSSSHELFIEASESGYIAGIHAEKIGIAARLLGAGRLKKEDEIDHGAGIWFHAKTGDHIKKGERILTFYSNKKDNEEARNIISNAISYSKEKPKLQPIVCEIIKNSV